MDSLSCDTINQLRLNARCMVRELGLLNDAYFEIGVTLAERHLLIELEGCQSPTMGEIAERLLLDKSTISRLISKAVKKGYIQCVTDQKDKRKRFLQITEKGKKTLHAFEPIAFNQTKEALLTLTSEEISTVYQGVSLYAKGLRSSRLLGKKGVQQADIPQTEENKKKMEKLPEIFASLNQKGYALDQYEDKDKEGLYAIFKEVVECGAQFPYECSSIEEFQKQFFHQQGKVYVCRSLAGEVIGGFYIRSNYSGRSNHIANAAYMIKDNYRGKGIGSLLIKASLHFAKECGFQAMQFNMVLSKNHLAIALYKRLGFTIVGTLPQAVRNPDNSYQDGYVMFRNLDDLSF